MRSLPKPTFTNLEVLNLCLTAIPDVGLQTRLLAISNDLDTATASYDVNATAKTLNLIPRVNTVGKVTKPELTSLYSDHMSKTNGVARHIYDSLRNLAPYKKCPLCGVGTVATLDHHLPKSKYPDLAIFPCNLVPACHFCNDTKKARFPRQPGQQTLHPYYDAPLFGARWMKATLDQGPPLVIMYEASPPVTWPAIDQDRVRRHFTICGIGVTFSSNANDELAAHKDTLVKLHRQGGAMAVRANLLEQVEKYSSRTNSWQLSLFEALANDVWFINTGFNSIA